MRRIISWLLVTHVIALATGSAAARSVNEANVSDEHIQKAIQALTQKLYSLKHAQRFWEPERVPPDEDTHQAGGYTALAVLALLHAGESYQEPRLADAIEFLSACPMEGTYAIATRTNVWAKLPDKFKDKLAADAQWLLDGYSDELKGWDYVKPARTSRRDNSIRQFAALALWEASKRGVKVDKRLWQRLELAYVESQLPDGGWNYAGEGQASGSMTAAALATLFITQDLLHATDGIKLGGDRQSTHQQAIDRGMEWVDQNFSAAENPGRQRHFFYYLWAVERAALAGGYKSFGDDDWYRQGASELIRRLCRWDEASRTFTIHTSTAGDERQSKVTVDDLAFGLIFLSRGRVPIAFNKLQFDGDWNNRPRDVANLTRWLCETTESDLNWQIVNLKTNPQEWMEAPILYIASHQPLPWMKGLDLDVGAFVKQAREFIAKRAADELEPTARPPSPPAVAELAKLKEFIDRGGMIVAVNEGGTRTFAESVEDAGSLMYPQYAWRALSDEHWAYTLQGPVKGRRPPLRGLSNGVRELIVLAGSGDLSEDFQRANFKQTGAYQTMGNLYFSASEMNRPRPRLSRSLPGTLAASAPQSAMTVIRAIHAGNWKPEPQALPEFAQWLKREGGIELKIIDHPLGAVHAATPRPALVMVSGVDRHAFTQREIDSIKAYVEAGGVILFETPGGRGDFAQSVQQTLGESFARTAQSLLRSSIITGEGIDGALNLTRLDYRPYTMEILGTRETMPRLRGFAVSEGGQPQVMFSREDISHALLDHPCWGISGYAPLSARRLVKNIVLHAMSNK